MLLALGNLSENSLWYWTLARIGVKRARHLLLCNTCWYFIQHCLCFYFHVVVNLFQLWFNFTPSHQLKPFGCKLSLQLLMRHHLCKVVQVFPSSLLPGIHRNGLHNYYGLICHLQPLNKSSSPDLSLISPSMKRTRIKASLVKLTFLFVKPSVVTCIQYSDFRHRHFLHPRPSTCQKPVYLRYVPLTY